MGSGVVTGGEVVVTAVLVVVLKGVEEEGVEVATTVWVGYTDEATVARMELSIV